MKKVALFILATVAPAFGAYTYYVTDGLTSASGNWTQNGTTSFTSTGFTSSGSSGLVSTVTPTGPADSTYEVRMVLALTQSGGMYSALLRASSNASLGASSATGTFYAVEVANVTFTSGVCSATLSTYKVISGAINSIGSTSIPCHNGMVVRAAMLYSGIIAAYIDNVAYLTIGDTSITSGAPGISVASAPAANTVSQVQLGPRDTVAPNLITLASVGQSATPTMIDLQWQGVTDDASGIGLWLYQIFGSGSI
jgi:hypothetical protein